MHVEGKLTASDCICWIETGWSKTFLRPATFQASESSPELAEDRFYKPYVSETRRLGHTMGVEGVMGNRMIESDR